MASLPRPSRPSVNPPSGPLPSIPLPKSRQASTASTANNSPGASTTSLHQIAPNRTASSSSIPTLNSVGAQANGPAAASGSSSPVATKSPTTPVQQDEKTLRKTISYNSFPKPPAAKSARPSAPNSAANSNSNTPRTSVRSSSFNPVVPSRSTSLNAARTSTLGERGRSSTRTSGIGVSTVDESAVTPTDDPAADEGPRGRPASTATTKDKGNVVISVRIRPEGDSNEKEQNEWQIDGSQSLISFRGREGGDYFYDNVFTANDKNARVYDSSAKRLVRRVMEGYHGTIFAYGMTGTGKTFSMQGTASSPGVIPLAITDIFSYIRETPHREFLLRVSYLEIYNEKIHDLLVAGAQAGAQQEEIKLREDANRGVYATPLKEEIVQSPTQLLRVIARGDHARRTSSTQFNARSSRSHAVVQIVIESRERTNAPAAKPDNRKTIVAPGGVRVSTLSLIDLAGSERAAESKERRTEGAHINKSLLTLGTVISKLSSKKDKQGNATDTDGKHLPYRDSKLTRLLQPALSGNSLISILCTIQLGSSGSSAVTGSHTVETLNTLKFAARARNNIVSHARKNEEAHGGVGDASSRALLDRYRVEIIELRKQLEEQKTEAQNKKEVEKDEQDEKEKEVEAEKRHEEQILEMQLARTALKERIEHLNRLILSSKSVGVNAGRSFSTLSLAQPRNSGFSTVESNYPRSIRSSASTQTLDASYNAEGGPRASTTSLATFAQQNHAHNQMSNEPSTPYDEDDDETIGDNGDGTASFAAQNRSLQADLADKNRYISTLEKRLLQARRTSRSRVSSQFRDRVPMDDIDRMEALLREKDTEIAELRERLDDKDRMLAALRSAARKRDTADTSMTNVSTGNDSFDGSASVAGEGRSTASASDGTSGSARESMNRSTRRQSSGSWRTNDPPNLIRRSSANNSNGSNQTNGNGTSSNKRNSLTIIPRAASAVGNNTSDNAAPGPNIKRGHGVDDVTRMLDDMIRQRVDQDAQRSPLTPNGSHQMKSATPLGLGINGSFPPSAALNNGAVNVGGARSPGVGPGGRLSTDGTRLSGWEKVGTNGQNGNRRRASVMGASGNSTNAENSANSSRRPSRSGADVASGNPTLGNSGDGNTPDMLVSTLHPPSQQPSPSPSSNATTILTSTPPVQAEDSQTQPSISSKAIAAGLAAAGSGDKDKTSNIPTIVNGSNASYNGYMPMHFSTTAAIEATAALRR